jgi:hypothetical protein
LGDVLILGGYGNFGKRIAAALTRHGVSVVIAGRHRDKAEALAAQLQAKAVALDAERDLDAYLASTKTAVVVNTCGPFQGKDYRIAGACIRHKTHYVDLADGRDFVTGIAQLDAAARGAGVCVISGASTVPGLSSAVVEHFLPEFLSIEEMIYGVAPGQKAERGLATTQGILTYVGKPLKPARGDDKRRYGWQDLYRQKYPDIGARWMANCDIPDLDLLPERYDIKRIHFSAGIENPLLHLGLFGISWLVRLGLPLQLPKHAEFLLRASRHFDSFGSSDGGMHLLMQGIGRDGKPHVRRWFIIAKNGDGPQIPCVPAILLAKTLASAAATPGARACIGLIRLEDYLEELKRFSVKTFEA